MSLLPTNPPIITREFSCRDVGGGPDGDRQGEFLWKGRCAGFYVQSWPYVEQILEIIVDDPNTHHRNTMSIIPTPGKPIHFGKVVSVELRQRFHLGLLVDWRIVLEAFIDPIFGMVHSSSQGHAQWMLIGERNQSVPGLGMFEDEFFAWADGILRYCFNCSAGIWEIDVMSFCSTPVDHFAIITNAALIDNKEEDLFKCRVTAGRKYRIAIDHDQVGIETFNLNLGIIKDPIDQT